MWILPHEDPDFLPSVCRQTVTISLRLGGAWRIGPWALLGQGAAVDLCPGVGIAERAECRELRALPLEA